MTDINLLPWRELKREREKKQFITYLLVGLLAAIIIVFLIDYYATSLIDMQTARNQRLKNEITQLDFQIKEISDIKSLREALIARMIMVQNLQATRTLTVRLLDEIIKILPEGVYVYRIDRMGDKITLLGYAESNTNISQLMRSIEKSIWIQSPELTEIKKTVETTQFDENAFKLSFILKSKTMLGPMPAPVPAPIVGPK
jgi:type IV pilus assembly protein PilN